MDLKEIMNFKNFVVVGNTLDSEKYAYKIKNNLIHHGYNVYSVHKEYKSINEIENDIDCIDLCINPVLGLKYLKECTKDYKVILIQPGAESEELINYIKSINKPFLEGCALVGIRLYKGELI
jgi:predicted CoA-binding protein